MALQAQGPKFRSAPAPKAARAGVGCSVSSGRWRQQDSGTLPCAVYRVPCAVCRVPVWAVVAVLGDRDRRILGLTARAGVGCSGSSERRRQHDSGAHCTEF